MDLGQRDYCWAMMASSSRWQRIGKYWTSLWPFVCLANARNWQGLTKQPGMCIFKTMQNDAASGLKGLKALQTSLCHLLSDISNAQILPRLLCCLTYWWSQVYVYYLHFCIILCACCHGLHVWHSQWQHVWKWRGDGASRACNFSQIALATQGRCEATNVMGLMLEDIVFGRGAKWKQRRYHWMCDKRCMQVMGVDYVCWFVLHQVRNSIRFVRALAAGRNLNGINQAKFTELPPALKILWQKQQWVEVNLTPFASLRNFPWKLSG